MIPTILMTAALLTSIGLATPAKAEDLAQIESQSPNLSSDQNLACAKDQAQSLPSPYTDVPQNHWAYKAILSMYYLRSLPRTGFAKASATSTKLNCQQSGATKWL